MKFRKKTRGAKKSREYYFLKKNSVCSFQNLFIYIFFVLIFSDKNEDGIKRTIYYMTPSELIEFARSVKQNNKVPEK